MQSESKWPYTAIACYKNDEILFDPVKAPDGMIISSVVSRGKYLALVRSAAADMNQLYYLNTGAEIPLGALSDKKLNLTPYIEDDRIFVYTGDKLDVTFFKIGLSDGKIDEIGTYDLSPYLSEDISSASDHIVVTGAHYDTDRNSSKLGGLYKNGETSIMLACINDGMLTVWDQGVVFDIQNDIITFSKMQDQH